MAKLTRRKYLLHRYPKLTLSVLALFGCVVAIILAELAARMLDPAWVPITEEDIKFFTYDELLGWAYTPNQRGRSKHQDFSVEVVINSQGMRDGEHSIDPTGEKRRMLILGDSFGWGYGVEVHERFSKILEDAHPDWEIINASVSAYGTDQEFLFLKERGVAFKPNVVLLLFYVNDFDNNIHAEETWHFKPFFVMERGELKLHNMPVPKATLEQRLRLFFLGSTYIGPRLYFGKNYLLRLLSPLESPKPGNSNESSGGEQRMYDVTQHLIRSMNELCKKNDSIFVLVSVPMIAEKRTFLQKIAAEEKIPYLPLDAHFESILTNITFPHDEHWNAKGHEIAGKAIDAFLWKSEVFGATSER